MLDKYFSLTGKVALVTGANRGLGQAIALGLAEAGADVIAASRNQPLLAETVKKIEAMGRKVLALKTDIGNPEEVKRMVRSGLDHFPKIDILVNNAGISGPVKLFADTQEQEWLEVIHTNLHGTLLCSRYVGETMIQNRRGKIINIASVLGMIGSYFTTAYSVTKAGIIQMTRNLALEWARFNINVNAIAPGMFETQMIEAQFKLPKAKDSLLKNTPMRRVGQPPEIVGLAILLASDSSDYITGAVISIDGGFSISKM